MMRAKVPASPTDPTGSALRALLAETFGFLIGAVVVEVDAERTTVEVEGVGFMSTEAEAAVLAWAADHLPELEWSWFCGDDRIHTR